MCEVRDMVIPNMVTFKIDRISETIAILRPNESETRSVPLIPVRKRPYLHRLCSL